MQQASDLDTVRLNSTNSSPFGELTLIKCTAIVLLHKNLNSLQRLFFPNIQLGLNMSMRSLPQPHQCRCYSFILHKLHCAVFVFFPSQCAKNWYQLKSHKTQLDLSAEYWLYYTANMYRHSSIKYRHVASSKRLAFSGSHTQASINVVLKFTPCK